MIYISVIHTVSVIKQLKIWLCLSVCTDVCPGFGTNVPRRPVTPLCKRTSITHLQTVENSLLWHVCYVLQQVANLVNADPREIIFTSGATESNNIAVKGVGRFYKSKKKHVITTQTVNGTCLYCHEIAIEIWSWYFYSKIILIFFNF